MKTLRLELQLERVTDEAAALVLLQAASQIRVDGLPDLDRQVPLRIAGLYCGFMIVTEAGQ